MIPCMGINNIATWDWAVFRNEAVWQAHGRAVEAAGSYLPGSFDTKPQNIAAKMNTGYSTWEYLLHTFFLTPALLHSVLPDQYWSNHCKLVRSCQIIC